MRMNVIADQLLRPSRAVARMSMSTLRWREAGSELEDCTDFTDVENQIGGPLAWIMRKVRKSNPYWKGTKRHTLWFEQSQINIPFLILASLKLPANGLAFIWRDCCHLQRIHEAISGQRNLVFHSSRKAFLESGEDYKDYIAEHVHGRIVVDVFGTGESILGYWRKHFREDPRIILLTSKYLEDFDNYESFVSTTCSCKRENGCKGLACAIERFNCSAMGSLVRWPDERLVCEHPSYLLEAQHGAIAYALKCIDLFPSIRSLEPDDDWLRILYSMMLDSRTERMKIPIHNTSESTSRIGWTCTSLEY